MSDLGYLTKRDPKEKVLCSAVNGNGDPCRNPAKEWLGEVAYCGVHAKPLARQSEMLAKQMALYKKDYYEKWVRELTALGLDVARHYVRLEMSHDLSPMAIARFEARREAARDLLVAAGHQIEE